MYPTSVLDAKLVHLKIMAKAALDGVLHLTATLSSQLSSLNNGVIRGFQKNWECLAKLYTIYTCMHIIVLEPQAICYNN